MLYNHQFRLTAERLEAAKARWQAALIHDYDLQVEVGGRTRGLYNLRVRQRRVVEATLDGHKLENAAPWTVEGLFTILERDLENDAKPDYPRSYTRAHFDAETGCLSSYLRSSGSQNTTLTVSLSRPH
jgi:hypothetical protein